MKKSGFIVLFLLLVINSALGQMVFEKSLPYQNVRLGGQSVNGEFYFFIASEYLVKYDQFGNYIDSVKVDVFKDLIVTDNEIVLAGEKNGGLVISRFDYNLNLVSEWFFSYDRILVDINIEPVLSGGYFVFLARTIIPAGTYKDLRLFALFIDKNGVKVWENQLPGNLSCEAIAIVPNQDEDQFYVLANEFEYTTTTNFFGRITKIDLEGNLIVNKSLNDLLIYSGFYKPVGIDIVSRDSSQLRVHRLNESLEVIDTTIIAQSVDFKYFVPNQVIMNHDEGISFIGSSVGVQLPSGFFMLNTDHNYQVTDTVIFYRGLPPSMMNGIIKTADKGYCLFGVVFPERKTIPPFPTAFIMKMDSNYSTGYRPSYTYSTIPLGLSTDMQMYWLDFDNDGNLDMLTINYMSIKLFRNNGGNLTEVTDAFPPITNGTYLSIADYDNNGFEDVYIQRGFGGKETNILYKNQGDGTFREVTDSGLTDDDLISGPCTWLDFNSDGYLDLCAPGKIYENNGLGKFTRKFEDVVVAGNIWIDINGDGYRDLLALSIYQMEDHLYLNDHGRNLIKTPLSTFFKPHEYIPNLGSFYDWDVISYDKTNKPSKIIAIAPGVELTYNEVIGLYEQQPIPQDIVYNNDPINFAQVDFDNNSYPDLFFNGRGSYETELYELLFNRSDGTTGYSFMRELPEAKRLFKSFSWIDLNKDGALDLIGTVGPDLQILTTMPTNNNWVTIQLEGVASSPSGEGALIKVKVNNHWQTKMIRNTAAHNRANEREAHFGIGSNNEADSVVVYWPSGCVQSLTAVASNQKYLIRENCSGENPVLKWDAICKGESLGIEILSPGTNFQWFTSTSSETPIAESDKLLRIDTLTRNTILYVANADSAILSRRVPVPIKVYEKPAFAIEIDSINSDTYKFYPSSIAGIETYEWSIDSLLVSTDSIPEIQFTQSRLYSICLDASNPGCETIVCKDVCLIINNDKFLFDIYPNPTTSNLHVKHRKGESFTVELISPDGRRIFKKLNKSEVTIPMESLQSGFYILQIEQPSNLKYSIKVIKL